MKHHSRISVALVTLAVLVAGCTSSAADAPPPASSVTIATGPTTSPPTSAVRTTSTIVGRAVRVFDVGGVEVVAVTETDTLPDKATTIEVTGTLIDSGGGPTLCVGAVATSLPPQCGGPIVDGLDLSGWSEEAQGVRWGERTVVVTWPPVDDHIQLISDTEPEHPEYVYPPGELPAECAGIGSFVGSQAINDYARTLGERSGGVYVTNDGVLVLQVTGDPQPHRDALSSGSSEPCVIEVERSEAEQRAIQDRLRPGEVTAIAGGYGTSTGPGGRVEVGLAVADRETVEAIAALVDDPASVRVIGWAVLLDG